MRSLKYIGLVWLMCLCAEAKGQAVATLGADTIALGDQTTLTIRNAFKYPSADMLSQNGVVALRQEFDTAARTQTTVITSFEPGEHYIRLGADDSLLLVVADVEIDSATAELRDIAAIERVPYTFWEVFRWVLLGLGVAALAFGLWWLLTHRKEVQQALAKSEPVDTRTPEERALQTLEALRRERLWQEGRTKEYHTRLTDAVRLFIEEATGIRATEMTSDETVAEVEGSKWNVECGPLRDMFTTADIVKFAKGEPAAHEHERSMDEAVAFVKGMWAAVKPAEETKGEEVQHE